MVRKTCDVQFKKIQHPSFRGKKNSRSGHIFPDQVIPIRDLSFIKSWGGRGIYGGSLQKYLSIRGVKGKNGKSLSALGRIPHKTIEKHL